MKINEMVGNYWDNYHAEAIKAHERLKKNAEKFKKGETVISDDFSSFFPNRLSHKEKILKFTREAISKYKNTLRKLAHE